MQRDYGTFAHLLLGFVAGLLLMIGLLYMPIVPLAVKAVLAFGIILSAMLLYQALESKNLYEIYEDVVLEFFRGVILGIAGGVLAAIIITLAYV